MQECDRMGEGRIQGYIFWPFWGIFVHIEKQGNLKEDLKKGREKGRKEEKKEKSDKTHVKLPL